MESGRAPTVSALCLAFELSAFEALGLDVERILGLAGVTRERACDAAARVSLDERFRWWDAALRVSGDPALGLRVGATLRVGALGGFEYLLRNSESLSKVLERANEYMRLIDDVGQVELRREGAFAAFRSARRDGYASTPPEVHCLFAALLVVLRTEWQDARVAAVRFSHAAPTEVAVFERHFGCPVRFDQPHDEVLFSADILALAPRQADGNLARVLEDHARHLLAQLPNEDPFLQSARGALLKLIDGGAPNAGALARAMHTSERTLRRRLEAEGTSYNDLLDGLRSDLARRYVAQTREGFEAIADRLAFADASTFFRAFKRWTGQTPAQFRESAKAGGSER